MIIKVSNEDKMTAEQIRTLEAICNLVANYSLLTEMTATEALLALAGIIEDEQAKTTSR